MTRALTTWCVLFALCCLAAGTSTGAHFIAKRFERHSIGSSRDTRASLTTCDTEQPDDAVVAAVTANIERLVFGPKADPVLRSRAALPRFAPVVSRARARAPPAGNPSPHAATLDTKINTKIS